ncbi:PREDICTED: uncharacterized protein LOC103326035 [Prunus mume]|uniref:Uncharacterized protein LOC103326035 n=1 Tax=Prunus mume TaxID=102107 RepID=A0ABM0NL94_PRUMU|nr:PREDICTED: uncharacterized protein LOC103326035 [Prunus mume]
MVAKYSTTKLHFLLLLLLFFLLAHSATPLNFSFSSFSQDDIHTIFPEGDAHMDVHFLRLTKSAEDDVKNGSVGRATYRQPFLLRENHTEKLAYFTTTLDFAFESKNDSSYGDSITFFIAPKGSLLNTTLGSGSSLGLPYNLLDL